MTNIIKYLKETYNPLSIIVYGSFQDGTNDEYSDFDCQIIVDNKIKKHDSTIINGIQLDCFIFTVKETIEEDEDIFLTVYDGKIILDTDGIAEALKQRVSKYVAANSVLPEEEKEFIVSWVKKTIRRAEKDDDEGSYRAFAFLWESLSEYFLLRNMFYFGSKKAVSFLKANDEKGYLLYHNAVTERTNKAISLWAEHVINYT